MPANQALWLTAVHRLERAIGEPVEAAVRSDTYFDAVTTLNPSGLAARLQRDVERSLMRARNGVRYVRGTHRPRVGATPKEVVWKRGKAELWRYRNGGPVRYGPPVVIVHSLVSRSYILDL